MRTLITQRRGLEAAAVALALSLAAGCDGNKPAPPAVKLPPELAAFQADIEKGKTDLDGTIAALKAVVAGTGDLKQLYAQFVEKHKALVAQSGVLSGRVADMKAKGQAYFAAWESQLKQIATPEIAEAAAKRRDEITGHFTELTTLFEAASESYKPIASNLSDLQKIIDNDLNPEGVKSLAPKAAEMEALAKTCSANLDKVTAKFKDIVAIYSPMK